MEKLNFDNGIREYEINGCGVLRFNPSDPNVYARLMEAGTKIQAVEAAMIGKAKTLDDGEASDAAALRIMAEADQEIKDILSWVFGSENDFNQILGCNVMSVGANGECVITNFIAALHPIIEDGAKKCASQQVNAAVTQARANRAQRRARG